MYILIDDDKLIHASWKIKARVKNLELFCFYTVEQFILESEDISRSVSIYIDSDLGEGIKGEDVSKRIFDLGFKSIYLATGFKDINQDNYPWLKGIVSKSPPF